MLKLPLDITGLITRVAVRASIFSLILFTLFGKGYGQTVNDNISKRSRLILDDDYASSSTKEATVEWNCINKSLTSKCLSYHNDQWFTFSVEQPGKYYLNISSQSCRDNNGVQAIVIEGNPCEIRTYKILYCIPRIRQQDVYIELDSLRENLSYLVNIDGFLGDYCSFDIQLSSKAHGFSHLSENLDTLNLTAQSQNGINTLNWKLPEGFGDDLYSFEVYRYSNGEKQRSFIKTLPLTLNSLGVAQKDYMLIDTVPSKNSFRYEIAGVFRDGRKLVLDQQTVGLSQRLQSKNQTVLNLSLHYRDGVDLQILLIDRYNDRVLRQASIKYNKVLDSNRSIFVGEYVAAGISNFMVRIINLKTHQKTDHIFLVAPEGKVLKK